MGNPIPIQERSVDPYSSYDSNVVNKLTRIISDGRNVLLLPSPIYCIEKNTTTVTAKTGKAIMDDVLIEIQNHDVTFTESDEYVNTLSGIWNENGYYYVVLCYEYAKTLPPPSASIKIIKPSQRTTIYNPVLHLFINAVEVLNNAIIGIFNFDPDNDSIKRIYGGTGDSGGSTADIRDVTGGGTQGSSSEDNVLSINSTAGATTLTLPLISTTNKIIRIVKISADSNLVTITRSGADTIEGAPTIILTDQYDSVTLMPYPTTNVWIQL